jgi:hypothetical protein
MRTKLRFIVFFSLIMFCFSCRSAPLSVEDVIIEEEILRNDKGVEIEVDIDSLVAKTIPADGKIIIAGITPHLYDRDDEEKSALIHAARQLVIYFDGAYVVTQQYLMQKVSSTQYSQKSKIEFDDGLIYKYLDGFTFLKESAGMDYYSALLEYTGSELVDIPEFNLEFNKNNKPSWINTPPAIDGYIAVVGVASRHLTIAESWEESDKAAMAEIAASIGTDMHAQLTTKENEQGSGAQAGTYSISSEKINNMLVLSRWREADHNTYYSLLVKKK